MAHSDYELASLLQEQFNQEVKVENPNNGLVYSKRKGNDDKSLTDPSWELIDPTPDIHILFVAFNGKYFWNKLATVCVSWSKRMTSCAGICSYQGHGGFCHITLSEPLLKLRPRKDLIETLLHEMIHAYLFVTRNNKDHDGHGPEFHKHMYRINAEAGTNITVYHSFHDEVELYKRHVWKCTGPCQHRKPFYGLVRRAMNRAPGPNDLWWAEHKRNCDGTFVKIKEPEKPQKNPGKENKSKNHGDIRSFYPTEKGRDHSIAENSTKPAEVSNLDYSVVRNAWLRKFDQTHAAPDKLESAPEAKRAKLDADQVDCPICSNVFPSTEINSHLDNCLNEFNKVHNDKREKRYDCPVCLKSFTSALIGEHFESCLQENERFNGEPLSLVLQEPF